MYKAPGVTVHVEEHGDIVSVCDSAANGKPAESQVSDSTGNHYPVHVTKGYGSCQTRSAGYGGGYHWVGFPAAPDTTRSPV